MTRTVLIVLGLLVVVGAVVGFMLMRSRSSTGNSGPGIDPVTGVAWQTLAQARASAS